MQKASFDGRRQKKQDSTFSNSSLGGPEMSSGEAQAWFGCFEQIVLGQENHSRGLKTDRTERPARSELMEPRAVTGWMGLGVGCQGF